MKPIQFARILFFGSLTLSLFYACTYKKANEVIPVVSYKNDIVPIIKTYCYGDSITPCHVSGGTGIGVFTDYAGVKGSVNTIKSRVIDKSGAPMPPTNSPSQDTLAPVDMSKLSAWIQNGAPNN